MKDTDHPGECALLKALSATEAEGSLRLRAERGGGAHPGSPRDGFPTAQREGSAELRTLPLGG